MKVFPINLSVDILTTYYSQCTGITNNINDGFFCSTTKYNAVTDDLIRYACIWQVSHNRKRQNKNQSQVRQCKKFGDIGLLSEKSVKTTHLTCKKSWLTDESTLFAQLFIRLMKMCNSD